MAQGVKGTVSPECYHPLCTLPGDRKGLCGTHYARVKRGLKLVRARDYDTDTHRYCVICKEYRPMIEFPTCKGKYDSACRPCRTAYWFDLKIMRKYGLTRAQYDAMSVNGCQCCHSIVMLVVDHCHATELVRGVLCNSCNAALGYAQDNPETLRALATYIEEFNATREA